MLFYQILAFIIHRKIFKKSHKIIHLKYQLRHGMKNFNYQIDHTLCQILNIILIASSKSIKRLVITSQ